MDPISIEKNGIMISILNIEKNKKYSCESCYQNDDCELKRKLSINQAPGMLIATELSISLANATNSLFNIETGFWELVSTDGYACGGLAVCDKYMSVREVNPNSWMVSPGTKVRFRIVFPEIEDGTEVAALLYSSTDLLIRIPISDLPNDVRVIINEDDGNKEETERTRDYHFERACDELQLLKQKVFSRFNNILTQKEITNLDNIILNLEFSINSYLETAAQSQIERIQPEYNRVISEYKERIDETKDIEKKNRILDQRVEQLYDLSPREFEEWTESLLLELGYDNVVLTPQSGDKGVDILCEKNGRRIAVQCKKFKGVVGTPLIQSFLGAIKTAEADKGFFITTGTFSIGAEKMVDGLPIELFDGVSLRGLIDKALNNT